MAHAFANLGILPRVPAGPEVPWQKVLSRNRALLLTLGPVLLLILATPTPRMIAFGAAFVLAGEAVRLWAAGTVHKNERVTSAGPYGYVRHPLYVGSFLIAVGFCLVSGSVLGSAIVMPAFLIVHSAAARLEERRLGRKFGDEYASYAARVGWAYPKRRPENGEGAFRWAQVLNNSEHLYGLTSLAAAALIAARHWTG